jgi:Succinyl-CoA ligase like flavodoxin domain
LRARSRFLAVKSGRSVAGARATSSPTGALLAASDVTVDALFHQAGVIRTETLHELFDVAALLTKQPIPELRCRRFAPRPVPLVFAEKYRPRSRVARITGRIPARSLTL